MLQCTAYCKLLPVAYTNYILFAMHEVAQLTDLTLLRPSPLLAPAPLLASVCAKR
jgi:hypothetical protein